MGGYGYGKGWVPVWVVLDRVPVWALSRVPFSGEPGFGQELILTDLARFRQIWPYFPVSFRISTCFGQGKQWNLVVFWCPG